MGKILIIKSADFSNVSVETITFVPDEPTINISTEGLVSIISDNDVYYTIDGSTPTLSSLKYNSSFVVEDGVTVKAITVNASGTSSNVASKKYSSLIITYDSDLTGQFVCVDGTMHESYNYISKKYLITGNGIAYASGRAGYSSTYEVQSVLAAAYSANGALLATVGNTQGESAHNWVNEEFTIPSGTSYVIVSGMPTQQAANLSTEAED